ncbi:MULTISPECIES: carbohydrate ABC transporter permease [unclassified Streptomyces]|uniref:carbohydrate ABC transporter permease n=1 Tax=unclassified Streptomyces TaxID=2593676 RepID=UPI0003612AF0|nr:ABC transporter permease subunit [Streptomyces sp. XHT-2]MYQ34892.1 ABC transporter permease subunit [Streptomyces sp. SID4956]MYW53982.1 ABC transporter permease subunit [Streptomyces sp. SID8376]THC57106.1 carbohydrate ABC transporter permease [Streptomyces sp. Akac8]WSB47140.1 carbohydrate ABC transporter permease [Streptomyces cellulosae]
MVSTIRPSRGYRVFQGVNGVILTLVVLITLYPFVNIVARSFSGEKEIRAGDVTLWPKGFNLTTYEIVFSDSMFWRNYGNTVLYTVVATAVAMVLTTCYAYVLSKHHLKGRGALVGIAVFTMFFTGGLIPNYVLITSLGLKNSVWAIALPNAISVFNLLVMKAFFESLPSELEEAAQIDGLSTYGILLRIVLPLSKAVVATMVLFYSVSFWNSWFSAFLYMDRTELMPVTVYLRNLLAGATGGTAAGAGTENLSQVNANIQAVTIVLTSLPILCVYPFVQRYFVSGVMLGAVKG